MVWCRFRNAKKDDNVWMTEVVVTAAEVYVLVLNAI